MSDEKIFQRSKQKIYFKNPDMDFYFMLALGYQSHRGSEYGECFYAASRIKEGDIESWIKAWTDMAKAVEKDAEGSVASGHKVSAREAYLRAYTYYRVASIGLRPSDPRFRETCDRLRASFKKSAALHDVPLEPVEIPFGTQWLPGYFMRFDASDKKRPTLIMIGGGETFAEDLYFWAGPAGVSRGYNVLIIDLPGQGMTPFDGLYYTVDFEKPVGTVVDYLFTRNDVDTSRIAISGISGGGYMVTRAVAYEKRIGACIASTPIDDIEAILKTEIPAVLLTAPAFIGDRILNLAGGKDPIGFIAFEKMCWQAGVDRPSKALDISRKAKVDTSLVTCPMLCLASTGDPAECIRQTHKVYGQLSNPKKAIHMFTVEEGADAHCQLNNLSLMHQVAFDWLDEVFQ